MKYGANAKGCPITSESPDKLIQVEVTTSELAGETERDSLKKICEMNTKMTFIRDNGATLLANIPGYTVERARVEGGSCHLYSASKHSRVVS